MTTINNTESLEAKLDKNKQEDFANERKVLTPEELSEVWTPFGKFNPEEQKEKEAEIAAKIAEEEAKENQEWENILWLLDDNNTLDIKKKSDAEFIWEQIWESIVQNIASEAILWTTTWWVSTMITAATNLQTINEVWEHIENKKEKKLDKIEMKKNKKSFWEIFWEEAKLLYKKWLVEKNEINNHNQKYVFSDLLEHVASNYVRNENEKWIANKNEDINNAFKETIRELLEWKHNQDLEKIELLTKRLSAAENLEDKYKIFLKIDNEIDRWEWIWWKKQKQDFERITKIKTEEIKNSIDFANKLIEFMKKNNEQAEIDSNRLKEIINNLKNENKQITQKEIIDTISEVSEILWSSIWENKS